MKTAGRWPAKGGRPLRERPPCQTSQPPNYFNGSVVRPGAGLCPVPATDGSLAHRTTGTERRYPEQGRTARPGQRPGSSRSRGRAPRQPRNGSSSNGPVALRASPEGNIPAGPDCGGCPAGAPLQWPPGQPGGWARVSWWRAGCSLGRLRLASQKGEAGAGLRAAVAPNACSCRGCIQNVLNISINPREYQ